MATKQTGHKRVWLITGILLVIGLVAARLAGRFTRPDEDDYIDDNAPQKLELRFDEQRYPPYYDRDVDGIRVEGELDEAGDKQLIVIGVNQKELDGMMTHDHHGFAIARCDGAGLWHPAMAEKGLWYGKVSDRYGDVYAFAVFIGPSILQIMPGVLVEGQFTPLKTSRVLALTNQDGLLYDYPNVPIVQFRGKMAA